MSPQIEAYDQKRGRPRSPLHLRDAKPHRAVSPDAWEFCPEVAYLMLGPGWNCEEYDPE